MHHCKIQSISIAVYFGLGLPHLRYIPSFTIGQASLRVIPALTAAWTMSQKSKAAIPEVALEGSDVEWDEVIVA